MNTKEKKIIAAVGGATFFFGFAAGAVYNYYLWQINSPLAAQFRTSLAYVSSILGDGILLPIVNMIVAAYLLRHRSSITQKTVQLALILGMLVTVYFHVTQALNGLVNWTMPRPWQWNLLGLWHAVYMFSVASLLALFYVIAVQKAKKREVTREVLIVTAGILLFLILLKMDYASLSIDQIFLQ